jgi:hypothetical protein
MKVLYRSKECDKEISTVEISDQHNCLYAGSLGGDLTVLDIETTKILGTDKLDHGVINSKWWKDRKVNLLSNTNGEMILQGFGFGHSNIIGKIKTNLDHIHGFEILNENEILTCGEDKAIT